jgi:hypothetical protein
VEDPLMPVFGSHPDPPIRNNISSDIENVTRWNYYDNYQSGVYVNENDPGYGPIKYWNTTALYSIAPTNTPGESCIWHSLFGGDISQTRFEHLRKMTILYDMRIQLLDEHEEFVCMLIDGYVITDGEDIKDLTPIQSKLEGL